jgi:hypothetical protein
MSLGRLYSHSGEDNRWSSTEDMLSECIKINNHRWFRLRKEKLLSPFI